MKLKKNGFIGDTEEWNREEKEREREKKREIISSKSQASPKVNRTSEHKPALEHESPHLKRVMCAQSFRYPGTLAPFLF